MTTPIKRLDSPDAYTALTATPAAVLIDVRDPIEFSFVGHPLDAVNIPWKLAPDMRPNADFVTQVQKCVPDTSVPLFLLCRSGQRSLAAAHALADAGYGDVTNIEDGFEGPIDEQKHRGTVAGWRFHGLPWAQS